MREQRSTIDDDRIASAFAEGVERFNARRYWDAHESWEAIWLHASGPMRRFLQGLIQIAAAYHHVFRANFRGAARLFDAGLRRLDGLPEGFGGFDRAGFVAICRTHGDLVRQMSANMPWGAVETPPTIVLSAGWREKIVSNS